MYNDNENMFSKGYPKRVFFKHTVPVKIYRDKFNNIIGVHPSRVEFLKIVSSQSEENILLNKKPVSEIIISEPIYSKPVLTRTKSTNRFFY
jgi:hypothetical protein